MKRIFKFGIVGAGVITLSHVKGILNQPNAELTAICDLQREKAQKFSEEYGIKYVYDSYEEMLGQEDLDVICICLPSGMHAEAGIAAAQAGKHVLCEKPLDITLEKIDELINACREHNVKLATVYQRRTMSEAIAAKKAIAEGTLGQMVLGEASLKYYRSESYYKSAGWRATWELDGGGALMNQGIHGIDLLQWMMGDVASVFAYAAPLVRDIQVEDTAVAVIKFKSGAFGMIQGATSVYPEQKTQFELHGELGTIIFSDNGIEQWVTLDGKLEQESLTKLVSLKNDPDPFINDGHTILIADLIEAIEMDRDPLIPGEEARKAVQIIRAIYESAQFNKEIIF